ncbi:hypothetical protein FACS1894202_05010 [Clostridia bacterium]|nr:hypothetical protein FACS1894202_05010 [Clostridia bacterium]
MSLETADIKGLNVEDALKRLRGNVKLYTKLVARFADGAELESLKTSLASGDLSAATRDAHTIKGAAANLSAEDIRVKAAELEAALKALPEGGAIDAGHTAMCGELAALYASLKEQLAPHLV